MKNRLVIKLLNIIEAIAIGIGLFTPTRLICTQFDISLQLFGIVYRAKELITRDMYVDKEGITWFKRPSGLVQCVVYCRECGRKYVSCSYSCAMVCTKCFNKELKKLEEYKNERTK